MGSGARLVLIIISLILSSCYASDVAQLKRQLNTKIDSVRGMLEIDIELLREELAGVRESLATGVPRSGGAGVEGVTREHVDDLRYELEQERRARQQVEERYAYLEQRVLALQRGLQHEKLERKSGMASTKQTFNNVFSQGAEFEKVLQTIGTDLGSVRDEQAAVDRRCTSVASSLQTSVRKLRREMSQMRTETLAGIETAVSDVNVTLHGYVSTLSRLQSSAGDMDEFSAYVASRMGPFISWVNRTAHVKGIEMACTRSTECWVHRSECRENICLCQPGYSYDGVTWSCRRRCDDYGESFQRVAGFLVAGHNEAVLPNVATALECQTHCCNATVFTCRAFDYAPAYQECYLQSKTKYDVPSRDWLANSEAVHFQRDCAV